MYQTARRLGSFILRRLQTLQLQPQTSLCTQDELGETANSLRASPEFGVRPRGQTKPEQGQRHDDSKLCQCEFLPNTVPVEHKQALVFTSASLIVSDLIHLWGHSTWGLRRRGWRHEKPAPVRSQGQNAEDETPKRGRITQVKHDKVERRLRSFFFISYMWVCPDSGVVVRSINTDQTDGTLGRTTQRNDYFSLQSLLHSLMVITSYQIRFFSSLLRLVMCVVKTIRQDRFLGASHPLGLCNPPAVACPGCTSSSQPAQERVAGETLWCTWWWREGWTDPPFR